MLNATANQPDEALGYHDRLPLSWMMLDAPLDAALLDSLNDDNIRVLNAEGVLQENRRVRNEDGSPLEAEIDRLHLKINLLLDMVGSLASGQRPRPAPCDVRLSAVGLQWKSEPLRQGARALLSLHLHRATAMPLRLPAVIENLSDGSTFARFEQLDESCRSALERHVFLHHRRAIAGAKAPAKR